MRSHKVGDGGRLPSFGVCGALPSLLSGFGRRNSGTAKSVGAPQNPPSFEDEAAFAPVAVAPLAPEEAARSASAGPFIVELPSPPMPSLPFQEKKVGTDATGEVGKGKATDGKEAMFCANRSLMDAAVSALAPLLVVGGGFAPNEGLMVAATPPPPLLPPPPPPLPPSPPLPPAPLRLALPHTSTRSRTSLAMNKEYVLSQVSTSVPLRLVANSPFTGVEGSAGMRFCSVTISLPGSLKLALTPLALLLLLSGFSPIHTSSTGGAVLLLLLLLLLLLFLEAADSESEAAGWKATPKDMSEVAKYDTSANDHDTTTVCPPPTLCSLPLLPVEELIVVSGSQTTSNITSCLAPGRTCGGMQQGCIEMYQGGRDIL